MDGQDVIDLGNMDRQDGMYRQDGIGSEGCTDGWMGWDVMDEYYGMDGLRCASRYGTVAKTSKSGFDTWCIHGLGRGKNLLI